MNGCLRERIFARIHLKEECLLTYAVLISSSLLASLSISHSAGNVTSEQWIICSEHRQEPIPRVLWAPLKTPCAPFTVTFLAYARYSGIAANFIFGGVRNREGRKKLWCLHISDKWCDAQFALITTLNTETHVIALMLLWCLQIIALSMYTVSLGCLGFAHWPVCACM